MVYGTQTWFCISSIFGRYSVADTPWPLWKRFQDETREYLAGRYEVYRDALISARSTKELVEFERRWDQSYGYAGPMSTVIEDKQGESTDATT